MINAYFVFGGFFLSLLLTACNSEVQPNSQETSPATQAVATTKSVDASLQTSLEQAIVAEIKKEGFQPEDQKFFGDYVDLNNDGIQDAVVILTGGVWCGTGGCTMKVFQGQGNKTFRLVSTSSLIRPPLTVSENKTNGWRDLIVEVSGGGVPAKTVALKFDGKAYPLNPSTQPAIPANTTTKGTVLFPEGTEPQTLTK